MRRFLGFRLAAVGSALACVLALVPVVPASAHTASDSQHNNNYLALGDSVPFGYNPLLVPLPPPPSPSLDPSLFIGYPQLAANLFTPKLNVFNASCPGETSTSLITGKLADDNGCQLYRGLVGPRSTFRVFSH